MIPGITRLVLLDSNVWIGERMLHSPLGAALLYALVQAGGRIALPEIVRREVDAVLLRDFDRTIETMDKSARWIRQLTGRHVSVTAPSRIAAEAAFRERWTGLAGTLAEVPFTLDQANAALDKILRRDPPSGPNNEQFRDCCIWEAALELAASVPVHLVTSDRAFFQERSIAGGLASSLAAEARRLDRTVSLHSSLDGVLRHEGIAAAATINDVAIKAAITTMIASKVEELSTDGGRTFEPSKPLRIVINGYATPVPSEIAVAFETDFRLDEAIGSSGRDPLRLKLSIKGSLNWVPSANEATDWQISGWSKSLDGSGPGFSGSSWEPAFSSNFEAGQFQIL